VQWFIVTLSGLVLGATTVVAVRHYLLWRKAPDGARLLPLHVWLVALSYDLLVLATMLQSLVLLRWWHPWVFVPALLLGLGAMYVISQKRPTRPRPDR
jgi:hypothetical protein